MWPHIFGRLYVKARFEMTLCSENYSLLKRISMWPRNFLDTESNVWKKNVVRHTEQIHVPNNLHREVQCCPTFAHSKSDWNLFRLCRTRSFKSFRHLSIFNHEFSWSSKLKFPNSFILPLVSLSKINFKNYTAHCKGILRDTQKYIWRETVMLESYIGFITVKSAISYISSEHTSLNNEP